MKRCTYLHKYGSVVYIPHIITLVVVLCVMLYNLQAGKIIVEVGKKNLVKLQPAIDILQIEKYRRPRVVRINMCNANVA